MVKPLLFSSLVDILLIVCIQECTALTYISFPKVDVMSQSRIALNCNHFFHIDGRIQAFILEYMTLHTHRSASSYYISSFNGDMWEGGKVCDTARSVGPEFLPVMQVHIVLTALGLQLFNQRNFYGLYRNIQVL